MNIRDWLEPMLKEWGVQRRRISSGRIVRRDGSVHEDGWLNTSVAAAPMEGGITGGAGRKQHFPEVYTGSAIRVWRAFSASPIEVREILHLHYVVMLDSPDPAAAKAKILGVSRKQYYIDLSQAQSYLAGRMAALTEEVEA